jgi:hypothetical protein
MRHRLRVLFAGNIALVIKELYPYCDTMRISGWQQWRNRIGPGVIIASLTIGSGELVFSTRAGALFGYPILFTFLMICLFKWLLIYTTGRQMIITGEHPFKSWMRLPGPRGWLPMIFLLFALPCFPVWIAFHASTVGSLLNHLVGTPVFFTYLWGLGVLILVWGLSHWGSYQKLERVQLVIVGLMLFFVAITVVLIQPQWLAILKGMIWPGTYVYPTWITGYPEIAARPVWIELTTYVGIVGGSSYDYLCYVAFIREKGWGNAGVLSTPENHSGVRAEHIREGINCLRWDSVISFCCVFLFSLVFVVCGHVVLAEQSLVPSGGDLLTLQATFVSGHHPWLRGLYYVAAVLAMFGTLYGTLEVGPAIATELSLAMDFKTLTQAKGLWRGRIVNGLIAGSILVISLLALDQLIQPDKQRVGFLWILTPANLFTGVMGCGMALLATLWVASHAKDRGQVFVGNTWKPLVALGGILFLALGIKGYWDHGAYQSLIILAATFLIGGGCAKALAYRRSN